MKGLKRYYKIGTHSTAYIFLLNTGFSQMEPRLHSDLAKALFKATGLVLGFEKAESDPCLVP